MLCYWALITEEPMYTSIVLLKTLLSFLMDLTHQTVKLYMYASNNIF